MLGYTRRIYPTTIIKTRRGDNPNPQTKTSTKQYIPYSIVNSLTHVGDRLRYGQINQPEWRFGKSVKKPTGDDLAGKQKKKK